MIDTTTVEAPISGVSAGITFAGRLRLDRDDDGGGIGQALRLGIKPQAAAGQRRDCRTRLRLENGDLAWVESEPQPAFEQGAAHFAGADQNGEAGKIA